MWICVPAVAADGAKSDRLLDANKSLTRCCIKVRVSDEQLEAI